MLMSHPDEPFDPLEFYSDEPAVINSESTAVTSTTATKTTTNHSATLRRSVRPKPAAESLISSPPAIKFYESTVIRKTTAKKTKTKASSELSRSLKQSTSKTSSNEESVNFNTNPPTTPTDSPTILKLRLNNSNSSRENLVNEKRNLRVVKLMMPDVLEDNINANGYNGSNNQNQNHNSNSNSNNNVDSKRSAKGSPVKFPLLAPKPTVSNVPVLSRPVQKPPPPSEKTNADAKNKNKRPSAVEIVNDDVCGSCGGLGNFICCDSCPRSFHFTCAEPPLDPQHLPEDDWYCNECLHKNKNSTDTAVDIKCPADIWEAMMRDAEKANPKCFVMPRRFRYQPKEEDLHKLLSGQLIIKTGEASSNPPTSHYNNISNNCNINTIYNPVITNPNPEIVINDTIKLRAPNISAHKSCSGYCHHCGRFGLTRGALLKAEEDASIPSDTRYHRPALSCSICPLYWHLDCLDPPLASFPTADSSASWTCPIHFTTEKCLALEVAESLVQATLLLPESAVQLQFSRKLERLRQDHQEEITDEEEIFYSIGDSVNVPEAVKQVY